jgi:hypothetical protein
MVKKIFIDKHTMAVIAVIVVAVLIGAFVVLNQGENIAGKAASRGSSEYNCFDSDPGNDQFLSGEVRIRGSTPTTIINQPFPDACNGNWLTQFEYIPPTYRTRLNRLEDMYESFQVNCQYGCSVDVCNVAPTREATEPRETLFDCKSDRDCPRRMTCRKGLCV